MKCTIVRRWRGDSLFPEERSNLVTIPLIVETKQLTNRMTTPVKVPWISPLHTIMAPPIMGIRVRYTRNESFSPSNKY